MNGDSERPTSPPEGEAHTVSLSVPDMDCPSCAEKIVNSVSKLDGVRTVEPRVMTGEIRITYDPARTDPDAVADRVRAAGYDVESDPAETTESFDVPGMDCPSCAGKIENALSGAPGVTDYDTSPTTGTVRVTYDAGSTDRDGVTAAIEGAGYDVTGGEGTDAGGDSSSDGRANGDSSVWTSRRALKTWIGGGLLVAGAVLALVGVEIPLVRVLGGDLDAVQLLFLAGAAVAGQEIVRNGYYSLRTRSLDIDLLMSLGVLGAVTASLTFGEDLLWEAAMLAVLFSIAELMEEYSMNRARSSLEELIDLSPETATVRRDGDERAVPVGEVREGDVVVVRPGEKVPTDGVVVEGESAVNQAPITGESVPVDKATGDGVYAGTINEEGYLEIRVTAASEESTLARIVELVEEAQRERTEHERFVDRFAGYYTPVVVTFAILAALVPPLAFGAPWATWFTRALALLVLACPCALVISTPVSVVSGVTSAARNGVLIKGGTHLEAMGEVDVVAFDKTGTLTTGELSVTDVVPVGEGTREDVLATAASLEARSEHPIAEAVVRAADADDLDRRDVTEFESLTGKGIRATMADETYYVGNAALFEELGADLGSASPTTDGGVIEASSSPSGVEASPDLRERLSALQSEGKTVVLVGTAERVVGLVAVADELRPTARRTVERLYDQGVERVVMLTGDNEATAAAIAEGTGLDAFYAELLPEEKADIVEELEAKYGTVAMVGDGINDAPALATASVGVAMGAAGTDTAIETADVALMGDDLLKLPYLHGLSRKAGSVIRQNIWSSIAVKVLLALGVPFGLVNVAIAVVVGDMGMSLTVTGNALRLGRLKPSDFEK